MRKSCPQLLSFAALLLLAGRNTAAGPDARGVPGTAEAWPAAASLPPPSQLPPSPTPALAACPEAGPPAHHLWNTLARLQEAYTAKTEFCPAPGPADPIESKKCLHFFVDAGVYIVQPSFDSNPAYLFSHQATVGGTPVRVASTTDFGYDLDFAPKVSVGLARDSGLGFRTSWWRFDQTARILPFANGDGTLATTITSAPVAGLPGFISPGPVARAFKEFGDQFSFNNHVKLDVWDWEVIQEVQAYNCWFLFAGGARYSYLSQGYRGFRFNNGTGTLGTAKVTVLEDSDVVLAGHSFSGAGPTGEFEVRRPLGSTGFTLYGSTRGSVLFGSGKMAGAQRTVERRVITPRTGRPQVVNAATLNESATEQDDVLPVGELEVGAEWARDFGRTLLFVRTGLVGQAWFGAGNATSDDGDLGFFGLALTGGVRY